MMLYRSPIKPRQIAEADGLTRADARVPIDGEIVHMGVVDPQGNIMVTSLAPERPIDPKTQQAIPFADRDLVSLEFLAIPAGIAFPEGYQFRATVMTPTGLLYFFQQMPGEKPRRSLLITGRGNG